MLFYSPGNNAFYDSEIHGDKIPADAREITKEQHAQLMLEQVRGKAIAADADGNPIAKERVLTQEQLALLARADRDALLDAADKKVNTLEDEGMDTSAWRQYRKALRDVPAQKGFPKSVKWPTPPA